MNTPEPIAVDADGGRRHYVMSDSVPLPRIMMTKGSSDWCKSTFLHLHNIWVSKTNFEQRWQETWPDAKKYRLWEKYPPEKPFGTERAMLAAIGTTPDAVAAGRTHIPTACVAQNTTLQDKNIDIAAAYRLAADHLYGKDGTFLYLAFDHINATYFDGVLPEALILWDITEWGRCLGWCRSPHDGPPIIKIHPSTVHPRTFDCIETSDGWLSIGPWRIPSAEIGYCYAYDVLLHECIHASVEYLRGGWTNRPGKTSSWTSHNNPIWVGECNRIGQMLGYHDIDIQMSKSKRVPNPNPNGPKTVVRRVNDGTSKPEQFPHNLDKRACFHREQQLPFELHQ